MATPQVPPRPVRSQPSPAADTPQVPPRPAGRRLERSQSPSRYASSPLNDIPFTAPGGGPYGNKKYNASSGSIDTPARPPSVSLPSIGQEGNEYADIDQFEAQTALQRAVADPSHTTSHVEEDLPLHAPKPGLATSDAKQRIAGVTRTDSQDAAGAGIGKVVSPKKEDKDPYNRPLKTKSSTGFARSSSSLSHDRPDSAMEEEKERIPHIGQHVPLLFNAGDVQAPSPGPIVTKHTESPSVQGEAPRHHRRARSGHNPPGSYGLHGHGVAPSDKFEKAWAEKHPDLAAREENGHYGPAVSENRHQWTLSSDDLNKIVHGSSGAGFGTKPSVVGGPDEQTGYLASEEYAIRRSANRHPGFSKTISNSSQTNIESPLRKMSFPHDTLEQQIANAKLNNPAPSSQLSEDEPIHIGPPEEHWSKYSKEGHVPTEDLGPRAENAGLYEEQGYSTPILASDEARPGQEYLLPAVSPAPQSRRGSVQDDFFHLHRTTSAGNSRPASRPSSRPGSIHGMPVLSKKISHEQVEGTHTPLDDVEEYEPLFKDVDEEKLKKLHSQVKNPKHRPDMKKRFPSQDIWEDAPSSVYEYAEVDTPEDRVAQVVKPAFETPEQEAARKGEVSEADKARLLSKEERLAASNFRPHLKAQSHRFPSRDIWEDSPDSSRLETTVTHTQDEDYDDPTSPDAGKIAGAVVQTQTLPREGATAGQPNIPPRPSRTKGAEPPSIPARPAKKDSGDSPSDAARPIIPDRPKPQVPPRPNKTASQDPPSSAEGARGPPPAVKQKPTIPARPAGGKIAALQAGFMADLNSRLKVGPQQHAKAPSQSQDEEKVEDKEPIQDARKGRARGPTKRRPGASPGKGDGKSQPKLTFSIASPWTVFSTSLEGILEVPAAEEAEVENEKAALGKAVVDVKEVEPPVETPAETVAEPVKSLTEVEALALEVQKESVSPTAERLQEVPQEEAELKDKDTLLAEKIDAMVDEKVEKALQEKLGKSVDTEVQTGEKSVVADLEGSPTKLKVIEGGSAQEEGTVVEKE